MLNLHQINIFIPSRHKFSLNNEINSYFTKSGGPINIYICEKEINKFKNNLCCKEWSILNSQHDLPGILVDSYHEDVNLCSGKSSYVIFSGLENSIELKYLKINGEEYDVSLMNIFVLIYDFDAFLKSEDDLVNSSAVVDKIEAVNKFEILNSIVKHTRGVCWKECNINNSTQPNGRRKWTLISTIYRFLFYLCSFSNFCVQLECFMKSVYWVFYCIWKEKKISVRSGNLLLSLLTDFFGGITVLYWINQLSVTPIDDLYYVIELIVNYLHTLLEWLMGSPAGLKLNHAFNTMLGKFFLYHIGLWWMFLVIIKSFLEMALFVLKYLGMFGITFQTAILADLLSLSSFHVYCIYTYAARLYNIQISGLIALWRLFLGRKHNPLRGGVDSCEYNHHQLFVGTLAFTILLFLLPTTFLYYVVFTSFRVILVLLGGFLTRLRYCIQSLPLYLVILWIIGSPRIAGNIKVTVDSQRNVTADPVYLQISLQTASLFQLFSKYHPLPITKPTPIKWKQLLSCLSHGNLLYPV